MTEALTGIDDRYDGVDAVVHLAAIPAPGLRPSGATFANNVVATHHVFSAARRAGIKNVVWASSETVLGLPFETPPPYVPVDEEYAVRPESTYSLGKAVEEEMARHFTRWDPSLKLIGLRFSNVMDVADYAAFPSFADDPRSRIWNLWGYIDARDGALAVRLALESDLTGFEAFIVASPDTVLERPSAELVARVLPGRPRRAGRSRAARRCCPSTRPAACSATTRSTPGATRSERVAGHPCGADRDDVPGRCRHVAGTWCRYTLS